MPEMKNSEGYSDPTPHDAIKNIEESREEAKEFARVHKLIKTIFYISGLAGFRVEGRIVLKDDKTGRVWR